MTIVLNTPTHACACLHTGPSWGVLCSSSLHKFINRSSQWLLEFFLLLKSYIFKLFLMSHVYKTGYALVAPSFLWWDRASTQTSLFIIRMICKKNKNKCSIAGQALGTVWLHTWHSPCNGSVYIAALIWLTHSYAAMPEGEIQ